MAPPAELFQHHVFVDLETTGLDPARDEVIEVGALFVEGDQVVRRLSRLFRPSSSLPIAIRRLTGLCDEDLADEPPFSGFQSELTDLLRGWTVVAHNARFEQGFLCHILSEVDAPVLDSCELLHYLYPELDSHSLESVVRWAGVSDRAAHRALKDSEDTFAVLQYALRACIEEGRAEDVAEVLECLAPGEGEDVSPLHPPLIRMLAALLLRCRETHVPLRLTENSPFLPAPVERLRRSPRAPGADDGEGGPLRAVTDAEVEAVLGPGGQLEALEDGFRSRQQQIQIARRVARTLSDGGRIAVEAGTGTGKSLAYLTPAALFAARNARKVAVAPHTRTLQDQLIEKDLPRLHRATEGAFGYALLKGQTNYLCRRRALELTTTDSGMDYDDRAPRAYLRAFLRRSREGDLDRVSWWFRERFPGLGPLVTGCRSEAATTLGERCPHFRRCYYHSAVEQAKEADVIVINQALALAWPPRYPKLEHLVLDEAHELEDVVTTAVGVELSDAALGRLGERLLGNRGRKGLLADLRRGLAGTGAGRAAADLLKSLELQIARIGEGAVGIGEAVIALCRHSCGKTNDRRGLDECRITHEVRQRSEWAAVREALVDLRTELVELSRQLGPGVSALAPDLSTRRPELDRELAGASAEIAESCEWIAEFADEPRPERCYFATAHPERGRWLLCAQPVDVRRSFEESLAAGQRALVLLSATLSTGPEEPWILDRLGLLRPLGDAAPAGFVRSGTPFDLRRQTLVVLVTDAPDPGDDRFLDWASDRICGLAQYMGGRVLGLFASTRRLEEIGERVRERLEPAGIEVLRQARGHGRSLAARQEQDHGSVLLGTKSFWQGLDIPGAGVACVFIDKLPLEPHTRPLVAAREEELGADRYAGFLRYRLPRALIQLRQGVGRLVRSHQDRGVVVIADPGSPRYRDRVFAALDGYRVESLPWARARLRIAHAIRTMGLSAGASVEHSPLPVLRRDAADARG